METELLISAVFQERIKYLYNFLRRGCESGIKLIDRFSRSVMRKFDLLIYARPTVALYISAF